MFYWRHEDLIPRLCVPVHIKKAIRARSHVSVPLKTSILEISHLHRPTQFPSAVAVASARTRKLPLISQLPVVPVFLGCFAHRMDRERKWRPGGHVFITSVLVSQSYFLGKDSGSNQRFIFAFCLNWVSKRSALRGAEHWEDWEPRAARAQATHPCS